MGKKYLIEVSEQDVWFFDLWMKYAHGALEFHAFSPDKKTFHHTAMTVWPYTEKEAKFQYRVATLNEVLASDTVNISGDLRYIQTTIKEIQEKMCCNCNNEQKKPVYFDTMPETLELSPEFLKKKCRDLTVLDLQVLVRWRMSRTTDTSKDALALVQGRVVQYKDHTVQECKNVL